MNEHLRHDFKSNLADIDTIEDTVTAKPLQTSSDLESASQTRPISLCRFISNLILLLLHYGDILLDLLLIYAFQRDENTSQSREVSYIMILLLMSPNLIWFLFFAVFELSTKRVFNKLFFLNIGKIFCVSVSHLQIFMSHVIWLYYAVKTQGKPNEAHLNQMSQVEYLVIMGNMFHVLFNSFPQVVCQFVFYLSRATNNLLALKIIAIQLVKICVSLLRISLTSTYFLVFFLKIELNVKLNGTLFFVFRSISNLIMVIVRLFSIALIFKLFPKLTLLYICVKIILNSLLTYYFVTRCSISASLKHYASSSHSSLTRFNSLRFFWTIFLGIFKMIAHFEDFDFKNVYFFLNSCLNFSESVLFVMFAYLSIESRTLFYALLLVLVGFWASLFIEMFYWKLVFKSRKAFIVKKFQNWLLMQTKISISELADTEEKFFSEEEHFVGAS